MFPQSSKEPKLPPKDYPELPVAQLKAQRKSSPIAKIVSIAGIAVVVLAAGLFFLLRTPSKPAEQAAASQAKPSTTSTATAKIAATTKHYNSGTLFLGFDYPADWQVTDKGKIEATSPIMDLPGVKAAGVKGRIVLTIQPGQEVLPAFTKNEAVAPIASEKLTYSSPTPNQRAQTYFTAVNYNGESGAIDAFYVTGDNGYTAGQYVPASDVVKANPLITLTFRGCNTTACTDESSFLSLPVDVWKTAGLAEPLQKMVESLKID